MLAIAVQEVGLNGLTFCEETHGNIGVETREHKHELSQLFRNMPRA